MWVFHPGSEWFWAMCQTLVFVLTAVFVVRQIKLQTHSHLVNSFSVFHERWNSEAMLRARLWVCNHYKPNASGIDFQSELVAAFFEDLAAHIRRGSLDRDLVWELYSYDVENYWPILQNGISCFRNDRNDHTHYHHFERLHDELLRTNIKKGARSVKKTQQETEAFIEHQKGMIHSLISTQAPNDALSNGTLPIATGSH